MSAPPPPPPVLKSALTYADKHAAKINETTDLTALITKTTALIAAEDITLPPPAELTDTFTDVSITSISPHVLFNKLQFGANLLIMDARSKAAFLSEHIRSAMSFDMEAVSAAITDDIASSVLGVEGTVDSRFRARRTQSVVLYDTAALANGPAALAAELLQKERRCQFDISILQGGLEAFQQRYPFQVTGSPSFIDAEFPSEIEEGFLFLGSFATASNRSALRALNVTYILNATDDCDMPFAHDPELHYLQSVLEDDPQQEIAPLFPQVLEFLRTAKAANARVLIHCKMGMSRSASFVVLWLMHSHRISLKKAVDWCRECRPFINPNPGFLFQLGRHEMDLFGQTSIRFPDPDAKLTVKSIYEWLQADGTWLPRVVVTTA
eukprot:m.432888 g.432888  ORF g.432888 m.432888 type:complete len:381 (-) comp56757_c0_seq4:2781-3923(-)